MVVEESSLGWAGAGIVHDRVGSVGTLAHSRGGDDEGGCTGCAGADCLALGALGQCACDAGSSILHLATWTDASISTLYKCVWTYTSTTRCHKWTRACETSIIDLTKSAIINIAGLAAILIKSTSTGANTYIILHNKSLIRATTSATRSKNKTIHASLTYIIGTTRCAIV